MGPKDREKKIKLASDDKFVKDSREQNRVHGSTGGGDSDRQKSGVWKYGVKGNSSVQRVERTKVRGARGAVGCENCRSYGEIKEGHWGQQ